MVSGMEQAGGPPAGAHPEAAPEATPAPSPAPGKTPDAATAASGTLGKGLRTLALS